MGTVGKAISWQARSPQVRSLEGALLTHYTATQRAQREASDPPGYMVRKNAYNIRTNALYKKSDYARTMTNTKRGQCRLRARNHRHCYLDGRVFVPSELGWMRSASLRAETSQFESDESLDFPQMRCACASLCPSQPCGACGAESMRRAENEYDELGAFLRPRHARQLLYVASKADMRWRTSHRSGLIPELVRS